MEALCHDVKPKNVYQSRPGPVGSVGDTIVKTRFRQSTPFMPWAFDPYYAGNRGNKLGSNVTDGDHKNYDDHGGPARTFDSKWTGNRSFKHQYGITFHDVQDQPDKFPDKLAEPIIAWLGDFSNRRRLARVRDLNSQGKLFKVMPGGYGLQPGQIARNGSFPIVTDTSGGNAEPTNNSVIQTGLPKMIEQPGLGFIPSNLSSITEGPTRQGVLKPNKNVVMRIR